MFGRHHHNRTDHIVVNTRLCEACGRCVEACPQAVLRVVGFLGHRHVHVDHADRCKGCQVCVRACPAGAMVAVEAAPPRGA